MHAGKHAQKVQRMVYSTSYLPIVYSYASVHIRTKHQRPRRGRMYNLLIPDAFQFSRGLCCLEVVHTLLSLEPLAGEGGGMSYCACVFLRKGTWLSLKQEKY